MTLSRNKNCPKEVREKLSEWEKRGWITINNSSDELDEQETNTPQCNPTHETKPQKTSEQIWCERIKHIANNISQTLNNQTLTKNTRGIPGSYTFKFDSEGFCKMIDELYNNHKRKITDYLHNTNKPAGVTFVFPFLGEILNSNIFNNKELQKTDLKQAFKSLGYNADTAVIKLSSHNKLYRNQEAKLFIETAIMIGERIKKAE